MTKWEDIRDRDNVIATLGKNIIFGQVRYIECYGEEDDPDSISDYIQIWADGVEKDSYNEESQFLLMRRDGWEIEAVKPPIPEQLAELPIGTRFTYYPGGEEYIKVGTDSYIETDEKLATNGMKANLGFLNAIHFDDDGEEDYRVEVVK